MERVPLNVTRVSSRMVLLARTNFPPGAKIEGGCHGPMNPKCRVELQYMLTTNRLGKTIVGMGGRKSFYDLV